MSSTATKAQWLRAAIAFFVVAVVAIASFYMRTDSVPPEAEAQPSANPSTNVPDGTETGKVDFATILNETIEQLRYQEEVDRSLQQELESGAYTFEEPLVVVNPYNQSPLTAVVIFSTPEPVNISVHIPGRDSLSDIDFIFEGYATEHIVPIYGLYAGEVNAVRLAAKSESGEKYETIVKIETEPLPQELADIILITDLAQPEKYEPGLNFTYSAMNIKAAFDVNGDYRWYLKGNYLSSTDYDYNGHILLAKGNYHFGDILFFEMTPVGKILKVFYAPYGCHHDIEKFSESSILVTGSEGETVEDLVYEIDTDTGLVIHTLDLKTILPRGRECLADAADMDWLHMNCITNIEDSGDIILSSRSQSLVARISWPDGDIKWILGSHDDWPAMYEKYLLMPTGEGFEWQYGQHSPIVLPDYDNNADTIDILLLDNGNERFGKAPSEPVEMYSRIVHYRIDETAMTVEQIWQYGKEQGEVLYSDTRGVVQLLSNGNVTGMFCVVTNTTRVLDYIELDSESQIVWEVLGTSKQVMGEMIEYRITRMPIYNESANEPITGGAVINLIPEEVLDVYEAY